MEKKRLNSWVKNLIALCLIGSLIWLSGPAHLLHALSEITFEIVVFLLLLSVVMVYISALKWKLFLEAFSKTASMGSLFNLYLFGYFVNLLFPSYVGGDIARSYQLGKFIGQHEAFTATILERYMGFVAMLLLALIFMWQVDLVTFEIQVAVGLVAFGLLVATLMALSEKVLSIFEKLPLIGKFGSPLRKIQAGFHLARKNKSLILKTLALSLLFHTFTVVNTVAAGYAVGWFDPPISELFVVLPLILLIGALPVAPSGLGIQEGAFYYFLTGIGATPAQALGAALVLRAKAYLLALCGGVVWFVGEQAKKGAKQGADASVS